MFPSSMAYIVQTGKANTPAITLYKNTDSLQYQIQYFLTV